MRATAVSAGRLLARLSILGVLASCGFYIGGRIAAFRLFTPPPWRALPSPPQQIDGILSIDSGDLLVTTRGGTVYRCCWTTDQLPQAPPRLSREYPCATTMQERLPPGTVVRRLSETYCGPDGGLTYTYIQLSNGDLWSWRHGWTATETYSTLLNASLLGLVAGLVVGAVAAHFLFREAGTVPVPDNSVEPTKPDQKDHPVRD